jgi:hypothetical protein
MIVNFEEREVDGYRRNNTIMERRINGDMVLVDSETNANFHLNRMGEVIWECMHQPVFNAEIIAACRTSFPDAIQEILERDISKLLEHLLKRRIILPVQRD